MKSNKFWIILLGSVIAGSVVVALFLRQAPVSYARIYKDGIQITDTVNLLAVTESYSIVIDSTIETGSAEGLNIVEVDHGRIRISNADCPDRICIRQGWVSSGLVPIVCLPNRVVITFEGDSGDTGVDAVVG